MKTLRIILALIYVVLIALLFILKGCEKEPEPRFLILFSTIRFFFCSTFIRYFFCFYSGIFRIIFFCPYWQI